MTIKLVTNEKIAETSSKGNQEKWFDEEKNRWYKLDLFGYEALAETVVSTLLNKSNVVEKGFSVVEYQLEKIEVRKHLRTGCSSENFLPKGEELITIAHLFRQGIGTDYLKILEKQKSLQKKISYIVEQVERLTGLERFGQYLTLLFEADMLFLNDDRHLNNMAVIRKEEGFRYCPLFDFGAGLLSNTREYPLDITPAGLVRNVVARPFHCGFTRQVHATQDLYGRQLEWSFAEGDLAAVFENVDAYYPEVLAAEFRERVETCVKVQGKKLRRR